MVSILLDERCLSENYFEMQSDLNEWINFAKYLFLLFYFLVFVYIMLITDEKCYAI